MPTAQTEHKVTLAAARGLGETEDQARGLGLLPALREVAVVLLVALIGLAVAAAIVLAPWHPAEAAVIVELLPPG